MSKPNIYKGIEYCLVLGDQNCHTLRGKPCAFLRDNIICTCPSGCEDCVDAVFVQKEPCIKSWGLLRSDNSLYPDTFRTRQKARENNLGYKVVKVEIKCCE